MTNPQQHADNHPLVAAQGGNPHLVSRTSWIIASVVLVLVGGWCGFLSLTDYEHPAVTQYVGPETCRECHAEQAESWSRTRMARTFEVLRPGQKIKEKELVGLDPEKDYTTDAKCLPCHTTGYGRVGGFKDIESTPHMAGVTCEACHGPGGMYVATVMDSGNNAFRTTDAVDAGLVYPPDESVCKGCHNEDSPFVDMEYKFDFKERLKKGTHDHHELQYDHGTADK